MRRLALHLAIALCAIVAGAALFPAVSCAHAATEWVDLVQDRLPVLTSERTSRITDAVDVTLVSSSPERIVLDVTLRRFERTPISIDGETWYRIALPGEAVAHERGYPALPDVRRSVVIPGDRRMTVTLLDSEYRDFPNFPIASSKGHLPRTVEPDSVPYSFAPFYASDGVWPAATVEGHAPYVLRDFRGMVVAANVFQYFPATRTLRVFTRMRIEITAAGPSDVNVLDRPTPPALDSQFSKLYSRHFLNFSAERYAPVLEDGGLLIIAYDAFVPLVEPLRQWNLQKGIPVDVVPLSTVGSTPWDVKEYIRAAYQADHIAYVLLVGDAEQVPTFIFDGGGADGQYSTLSGLDIYPELFVGRFSAETPEHVSTQVERTIAYERDVASGETWSSYATGIASDSGPGHYDEYDYEHMNYIRADLLAYGYAGVDTLYEPFVENWMVTEALEEGRGFVNYIGHGSTIGWGTSGFDTSEVNALTNVGMLPFVHSVACRVGKFDGWTCFGEEWLRSTHEGRPTGGIAVYMSSSIQDWDPPMTAQDETTDLLVSDSLHTVGGLLYNGACRMLDEYGSDAANEFLTWIIFGDPSITVRTRAAEPLSVAHRDTLFLGQREFDVTVSGVPNALCSLYGDSLAYGAARTDGFGQAIISIAAPPTAPTPMLLTVTAPNKATYIEDVLVIPATGPCLYLADAEYLDGNGDGVLNAGERITMRVRLRNDGLDPATGIQSHIGCASHFIDLGGDEAGFPNIGSGEEAWCGTPFTFDIAADCPDGHPIHMPLALTTDQGQLWDVGIDFTVHAPGVSVAGMFVDDETGGDGDHTPDPGETFSLSLVIANEGSYPITNLNATLSCANPLIQIISGESDVPFLGAYANEELRPPFEMSIDSGFTLHLAFCRLAISGDNGFQRTLDVPLRVGEFYEDVESGPGDWAHGPVTSGFADQWYVSGRRNHSPFGYSSWQCGADDLSYYAPFLDAGLTTPPLDIGPGATLRFWHWISAETALTYPDSAFDGGLVELSLDGGPFQLVTPVDGYPYRVKVRTNPVERGPFAVGTPVFCGLHDWQQVTIELGEVYGSAVFRFRFGSDATGAREGWYIDDIEVIGLGSPSAADDDTVTRLVLPQNTPNPFRSETRIAFICPREDRATLQIFDPSGRIVRTLIDGPVSPGAHVVAWRGDDSDGRPMPSGIYYYRLAIAETSRQRPMIRIR